jgi:Putative transposase, YhgA-like
MMPFSSNILATSQTLGRYIPDFEPHFVDLSTIPDEAIQGEIATQLFVRVLKYIFTHGLGGQLDQILHMAADVMSQPSGRQMIMALLRYIARSGIEVDREEMAQKFLELLPTEGGVLMKTMAEEWIEEGKLIGLSEGEKKGQKKGQTKTILRILQHRFQPNDEALMELEQLLLRIANEADLNYLTDRALEGSTLESWVDQLTPFVPPQPTASPA